MDRRRSFERDGILSTTALLLHRCGMAGSTAREKVRVARALESMAATREAFICGHLSYSKARMLATARETNPDLFASHETALTDAISPLTVRDASVAVEHWRNAAAPQAAVDKMEAMHEQRRLTVAATFEGMIHLEGRVDPVDGAYLTTALAAVTARAALGDARASLDNPDIPHRSPAQRRMDGLVEICRQWLANGSPTSGGERPHMSITLDLPTLEHRAGDDAPSTTEWWTPNRHGCWRVTAACPASSPTATPCRSTSGAAPAASHPPFAPPWWCGTVAAGSPGVTGRHHGPTATTSPTGPTADQPASRTGYSSAAATTQSSTAKASPSTRISPSTDPTAPHSRTGDEGDRSRQAGGLWAPTPRP